MIIHKLTSIGDLANDKHDEVAIGIMERLDYFNWSYNNGSGGISEF